MNRRTVYRPLINATLAVALAARGLHAQTPPWVSSVCSSTWSGGETWIVQDFPGTHAIGFTVSQYSLVSFPATTGLYATVPAIPSYTFTAMTPTPHGVRTTDSIWVWNNARLDAVCQKRTWNPGTGFEFTEFNVLLGPTHGLASLLKVIVHDSYEEDGCEQDLGCEGGGGEGGGGGGGGTTYYLCYYWDYFDGSGNFLYREIDHCEEL